MGAELRIGGGGRRVWGYGMVGPGLALSLVDIENGRDDTDAGFNLRVGAGIQGAVCAACSWAARSMPTSTGSPIRTIHRSASTTTT